MDDTSVFYLKKCCRVQQLPFLLIRTLHQRIEGTDKSTVGKDSLVYLMYHAWSEWSYITDPDLDHSKGIHPYILPAILTAWMQSIFFNKWNWIEWEWYHLLHNIALKFGLYLLDCLGVVQLLNKLDGTSFNKNDENLFEVFLFLCHFSGYHNFHCRVGSGSSWLWFCNYLYYLRSQNLLITLNINKCLFVIVIMALPNFKPRRAEYESVYYGINNTRPM